MLENAQIKPGSKAVIATHTHTALQQLSHTHTHTHTHTRTLTCFCQLTGVLLKSLSLSLASPPSLPLMVHAEGDASNMLISLNCFSSSSSSSSLAASTRRALAYFFPFSFSVQYFLLPCLCPATAVAGWLWAHRTFSSSHSRRHKKRQLFICTVV